MSGFKLFKLAGWVAAAVAAAALGLYLTSLKPDDRRPPTDFAPAFDPGR